MVNGSNSNCELKALRDMCTINSQSERSPSPMSLYLAFFILIVGCRCSSSASILETEKPALEGLSPTKYPVTSPIISPTSAATLNGYVAIVLYSDYFLCKTPLVADFKALNTCFRSVTNEYTYVTATSSSLRSATYTDSMCTLGEITMTTPYTDGACFGSSKIYVTSTSAFTADVALGVMR